jgi:hypothetical protein
MEGGFPGPAIHLAGKFDVFPLVGLPQARHKRNMKDISSIISMSTKFCKSAG